ncbi:hypothetical protein ACFYPG_15860 [Micromonospora sp. NPDC005553]|uniref:hypothetical protein n=1 Tax=Micromonospora sp. NPDC005553 TaxID=3364232 RepID=UPI0036905D1F
MGDLRRFDWKPERELASELLEKIGIPVAPFMRYAEAVVERRARRAGLVLAEASERSGRSQEDILLLAEDDLFGDLLTETLQAASTARSDAHLHALALVLANAVAGTDGALVDHLHEVVRVLARLSPLDIRALHALEATGPLPSEAIHDTQDPLAVIQREFGSAVLSSPIAKKFDDLALVNRGIGYDEGQVHIVTPFGREVLGYLRSVLDQDEVDGT